MNWYVIYTKPKREATVADRLRNAGIEVYHPRMNVRRYLRGRYVKIVEPLFPCYLFARFDPGVSLWMICYTRGVRNVVRNMQRPSPVTDDLIDSIRCREDDQGRITLTYDEHKKGDRVTIKDGPFAGFTGIFERPMKGDERVMLLLQAVSFQARIVLERASLKKAG